jgi:transposase
MAAMSRGEARALIVRTANQHRQSDRPITMRHINRAVAICRRRGLVDADVLAAAGFRVKAVI